jgi:hypothetical protein
VIHFEPGDAMGYFTDRLELTFRSETHGRFVIIRSVTGVVGGSKELLDSLAPISPYIPPPPRQEDPLKKATIIEGIRPPALAEIQWVNSLPENPVPRNVMNVVDDDLLSFSKKIKTVFEQLLKDGLNVRTVADFWKNALWIEEAGLA